MRTLALGLALLLAACGAPDAGMTVRGGSAAAEGTPEGLPPQAPARFGFGEEASPERVAMWDIDVRPDGTGLPAGEGTVAEGRQIFETYCVECHGATGTEGPNDRLVGRDEWGETGPSVRTVGSYWQYPTTLFDYIRRAMPHLTPGLLTSEQVYALVAHILNMNDIVPDDAVMNAETLPGVEMPSRDRFVLDDRQGGSGPIR
jgi:cytochrome c